MLLYRDDENVEKVKELERAAVDLIPEHISEVCARLGQVKLSARALGLACRFRGVDCVRTLVEGGATFDTPKTRDEEMLYHAYSIKNYDFNHSNYSVYLLNIEKKLKGSYCSKSMRFPSSVKVGKIRLYMLSDSERIKVLKYLCDNREKCSFDPSELLFYSIFARDDFISDELKKLGIKLSKDRIKALTEGGKEVDCYWREYRAMTDELTMEDFFAITERLFDALDGKKIRCTDQFFKEVRGALNSPKFAEFFFDKFNTNALNKTKLLREMIDKNNTDFLPIAEKAGWLSDIKRRDSLIEYASENGKTECTAWLLDFKNRTADLTAEREKAERKFERELNAAPDSVMVLKTLWGYKKLDDGTLMITSYKGIQTDITVPKKIGKSIVTAIGDHAFSPVYSKLSSERSAFLKTIKRVTLPDTITKIGDRAFGVCLGLTEIDIPDSVRDIGSDAFIGCENLERVRLPGGLSEIPDSLFYRCLSLEEITIPESVKKIGSSAFFYCRKIEKIKLPMGLTEIKRDLFGSCQNLREVTICGSVKNICDYAFRDCKLIRADIPDGVVAIGRKAFSRCKKLETVTLPASIKQIANSYSENTDCFAGTVFESSPNVIAEVVPNSYAENYCKHYKIPYKYKE